MRRSPTGCINVSFGLLPDRVWKHHIISLKTKVKVYKAVVLSNLLYGCETWSCYPGWHVQQMENFHMRHLRALLRVKWQDKVTNNEILQLCELTSIE